MFPYHTVSAFITKFSILFFFVCVLHGKKPKHDEEPFPCRVSSFTSTEVIKFPISGGSNLMQMYGNYEGVPL